MRVFPVTVSRRGLWTCTLLRVVGIMLLVCIAASPVAAQSDDTDAAPQTIIRTDSPQDTFDSFQRLTGDMEDALAAYIAQPSFAGVIRLGLLSDQLNSILDLDQVAASSHREVGIRTMGFMMDIFGRLDPIDLTSLPDYDAMEASGATSTRIPGTPIYISRVEEGDRKGEYLSAPLRSRSRHAFSGPCRQSHCAHLWLSRRSRVSGRN